MSLPNLHTERLILIPVTAEVIRALLSGNREKIEELGIHADEGWPNEDTRDILPMFAETLEKNGGPSGFEFWMVARKEDNTVIGDFGFHGKPNDKGEAEVGYTLVERERGKGYGFEALKALMDWAFQQESVRAVKASCLIGNKPSARILEKAGLREVGRDTEWIYWELSNRIDG